MTFPSTPILDDFIDRRPIEFRPLVYPTNYPEINAALERAFKSANPGDTVGYEQVNNIVQIFHKPKGGMLKCVEYLNVENRNTGGMGQWSMGEIIAGPDIDAFSFLASGENE